MMADLALVSLDDLLEELFKRHDSCVLMTLQNINGEEERLRFYHKGSKVVALGLCDIIQGALIEDAPGLNDSEEGEPT